VTLNTSLSEVIYDACIVLCCIKKHMKFEVQLNIYMIRAKLKTGHVILVTPIRGQYVVPKLACGVFYLRTKFGDSCFSRSGDMIAGVEIENVSRDPDHAHFRGRLMSES